ncbi:MAG: hypothetical protein M1816_005992 [Peltula sp. TS41687]|nr:MAG: hypothetical protein M1816_005992 [Peltula sp. TS41687]
MNFELPEIEPMTATELEEFFREEALTRGSSSSEGEAPVTNHPQTHATSELELSHWRCEVGVGITEWAIGVGKSESEDRDRRVGVGVTTARDKEGSGYAGSNGGCQGNTDTRPTNS